MQGRGIDASLNETGRRQAKAIANYLKDVKLKRIFSSSLKRSRETAELVALQHNLQLESHADLDEMDFGVLEGCPVSEIECELEELHNTWKSGNVNFACEGGESPKSVLTRAANCIDQIIKEHQHENLLFVLHGRLIRILVSHWLGYGLAGMHRVPHANGALYHLQKNGAGFEPIFLNHTDHLELEVKG